MTAGWRYFKYGDCASCGDPEGALSVPVLEGTLHIDPYGNSRVRGNAVFNFPPLCKKCQKQFDLSKLCSKHKAPLRDDGRCLLCTS